MVMIEWKLIGTAFRIVDLLDEPAPTLNTVNSENVHRLRLSVFFYLLKQSSEANRVCQQACDSDISLKTMHYINLRTHVQF